MRLLHYTAAPFEFDPSRTYGDGRGFKPCGLWVSVEGEDDWPAWCRDEKFALESLAHASEIALKGCANVLRIDTLARLDAFNVQYRLSPDHSAIRNIDWRAAQRAYDGIIIAPYQWERRLDLMWYYVWDCASGVIWNLGSVERVTPVDVAVPVRVLSQCPQ